MSRHPDVIIFLAAQEYMTCYEMLGELGFVIDSSKTIQWCVTSWLP